MKKKSKTDQERIMGEIERYKQRRQHVMAVYIHPNIVLDDNVVKPYPVFRKNSVSGWYIEIL